jgi:tRNA G26 N,N-dimethylase Trm1
MLGVIQAQITQTEMLQILADYDREASELCNKNAKANWNVQTDVLNDDNKAAQVRESVERDVVSGDELQLFRGELRQSKVLANRLQ